MKNSYIVTDNGHVILTRETFYERYRITPKDLYNLIKSQDEHSVLRTKEIGFFLVRKANEEQLDLLLEQYDNCYATDVANLTQAVNVIYSLSLPAGYSIDIIHCFDMTYDVLDLIRNFNLLK